MCSQMYQIEISQKKPIVNLSLLLRLELRTFDLYFGVTFFVIGQSDKQEAVLKIAASTLLCQPFIELVLLTFS